MSGSGLIYAAVLAAWAVYFVSRTRRSGPREVLVPNEGVVLRRRGASDAPAGTYSLLRPAAAEASTPVVKQRSSGGGVVVPARRGVSAATARRRRRTVSLLISSTVVLIGVAGPGLVPAWTAGVPLILLLTYLVELRTGVRRATAPEIVERVAAPDRPPRLLRRSRHREWEEYWDPWPSFDPADAPAGSVPGLAKGWEPRSVPLPTYVTAPRAETVPGSRRIDIPAGRAWIEPPEEQTQPIPADAPAATVGAQTPGAVGSAPGETPIADDLAAEFEHRRAVND